MKRILVPTDFSDVAGHGLDFAAQICRQHDDAEILLYNVVEYVGESGSTSSLNVTGGAWSAEDAQEHTLFMVKLLEQTRNRMQEQKEDARYDGIRIVDRIEIGSPAQSIVDRANDPGIDLVVMGTGGVEPGFFGEILGSHAERVVRLSKKPVITVRKERQLTDIKKIAFATNLHEDQGNVVGRIKEFQALTGAELHLVWVNTPNRFHISRDIDALQEKYVQKYQLENCHLHTYNDITEEDGIIHFAQKVEADMIAMGTHGRTGIWHLLSGSVAEEVVNHANRPVWTMKQD